MSNNNYVGPSQEFSPGDIDPVSNHIIQDVDDNGDITSLMPFVNGTISDSAVRQFQNYAANGDLLGYYSYLASFGSGYGEVGVEYYSEDQGGNARLSDAYTTFFTGGKFSKDKPIYNKISLEIMQAHFSYLEESKQIPTTSEIFQLHYDVFAKNGIPGTWIGSNPLLGWSVDLLMGTEPSDTPLYFPYSPNYGGASGFHHCFPAGTKIRLADGSEKAIEQISTNDRVASFHPEHFAGRGGHYAPHAGGLDMPHTSELEGQRVVRLFENITDIKLKQRLNLIKRKRAA